MASLSLRAMGFCGADDSVDPKLLQILSKHYPWIEWGVLFRPDLEGTPRYATMEWVHRLSALSKQVPMKLAAHLCGSRCQEILSGDWKFVSELVSLGFKRVQVNATAANRVVVDPKKTNEYVDAILECIKSVPDMEWIIQTNAETKPLWTELQIQAPSNMSILFDASCGLGVPMTEFPAPHQSIPCGYAGGIGPSTISSMLCRVKEVSNSKPVWIDMESSLRSIVRTADGTEQDAFSIEKCFQCISIGVSIFDLPEFE